MASGTQASPSTSPQFPGVRRSARLRQPLGRLASLTLATLLLAGCASPLRQGNRPEPNRLRVITTVAPVTLFTRAVAGDCAEVSALLPAGRGPHGFQSRPSDLLSLRRARLLVINGLGLESFLDGLLRSAGNRSLRLIDSSRGVPVLAAAEPAMQLSQAGAHDHHDHGSVNPHIWLDPRRAVRQVETIRDGLIAADPGCAAGYRQRAAAYVAELQRLDAEIAATLLASRGRTFVVFHDFAPYFADRYGLKAEFLVNTPEQSPSPADVQRVVNAVRDSRVTVLLRPTGERQGIFETLAKDLRIKVAAFSPVETLSDADLADPATYLRLMRANAAALHQAFAP